MEFCELFWAPVLSAFWFWGKDFKETSRDYQESSPFEMTISKCSHCVVSFFCTENCLVSSECNQIDWISTNYISHSESFEIGATLTKHVCHFKKGMTKLMMYIDKINNLTISIPIPIIELSALDFHYDLYKQRFLLRH